MVIIVNILHQKKCVTTLTLGSQPRQGLAKGWAKNETWESHFMFPRMWENVKE
jgi:hypothetical protein